MQVNINLTRSKMPFKAYKNNKTIKHITLNNQISFGDSYNSHTRKSSFEKFIKKLGFDKKHNNRETIQLFEMNIKTPIDYNQADVDMINFYSGYWNIDPLNTLFIASYRDEYDCPKVVFNAFSLDALDNEKMQLFVLESPHRGLTDTQKAAFKLFHSEETRRLLQKGSLNNPLSGFSSSDSAKEINSKINKLARGIQNPTWAKYCANAEKLDPVIYSADGSKKYWFNPKNL